MRHRSRIWEALSRRNEYQTETVAVIDGKIYAEITAPKIERALMGKPLSVGNCISATLELSVLTEDDISRSSSVVILSRLTDGRLLSEWLEFGTFFIDKRDVSRNGLITLTCYDAMLKANAPYPLRWDNDWPKTMKTVVETIAERLGVHIDPRTRIKTGDDYVVPRPEGLTLQQVLGYIGSCHGGNWIITEDNLLRLVPLITSPDITRDITDLDYNLLETSKGDKLVYEGYTIQHPRLPLPGGELPKSGVPMSYRILDALQRPILMHDSDCLVWATADDAAAAETIVRVSAVLGELSTGRPLKVTGISMSDSNGNEFAAGTTEGSVITIAENPYATQSICEDLYSAFAGLIYSPYKATKGIVDVSCELGDGVVIGDKVHSVIYGIELTLDTLATVDVTAPDSEDLEAEYPYTSMEERRYNSLKTKIDNMTSHIASFITVINKSEQRLANLEKAEETDPTVQSLSLAEIAKLFD